MLLRVKHIRTKLIYDTHNKWYRIQKIDPIFAGISKWFPLAYPQSQFATTLHITITYLRVYIDWLMCSDVSLKSLLNPRHFIFDHVCLGFDHRLVFVFFCFCSIYENYCTKETQFVCFVSSFIILQTA